MSDDLGGPPLRECPVCGAIGLPEQIAVHDCELFQAWRRPHDASVDALERATDD